MNQAFYPIDEEFVRKLLKNIFSCRYIKKKKLLRLPSESTIQSWLKKFKLGEGFLDDCIAAMKGLYGQKLKDRQIVIAFDEMALRERWTYDQVR